MVDVGKNREKVEKKKNEAKNHLNTTAKNVDNREIVCV